MKKGLQKLPGQRPHRDSSILSPPLKAATYLARNGFPVTVIEQRDVPGGYATAFERGAFTFDVSLHWTYGARITPILEECGIKDKFEMVRLPQLTQSCGTCAIKQCSSLWTNISRIQNSKQFYPFWEED